jgi:hypothetical protein
MMPRARFLLPVLALLLALPLACQEVKTQDPLTELTSNRNIRFGMPGPAVAGSAFRIPVQ